MEKTDNLPCNFDHNGECLICDCWIEHCAFVRWREGNYKFENEQELNAMFEGEVKHAKT